MTAKQKLAAVLIVLASVRVSTYEDNTHQELTKRAAQVAVEKGGVPQSFYDQYAQSIIAGAGLHSIGEDYTAYFIDWDCPVKVITWPWIAESLNHFDTFKLWGGPAYDVFLKFYSDAVGLWHRGRRAEAALILGRALHLIEDMAQPQHALDESHLSFKYARINPSFLEFFTEAHIQPQSTGFCPENGGYPDYSQLITEIDSFGCGWCSEQLDYFLDARSASLALGAPSGGSFNVTQLRQWFPGLKFEPAGSGLELPFQFDEPSCGTKRYKSGRDFHWGDFTAASINSIDLGWRFKEAGLGASSFGTWHRDALLTPAVADAAGVVVAFWNDVKKADLRPNPCLPPRGGGSCDDSAQVKSSIVSAANAAPASSDWHNICRVGIGKGLSSMADYGVSSSLFDQISALDPDADPSTAEALYSRLESLEAKYSGPQNVMPREVEEAPQVAVWEKGFGDSARSLVESLNEPVRMLEEPQEPVFTDEQSLAALPLAKYVQGV